VAGPQGQGNQVPPSQAQVAPPGVTLAPVPQQQRTQQDIVREKLAETIGEIIAKAQELGFELATLDYGQLGRCPGLKPLVEKSRELVVALKKLMEMRKELVPGQ